MYDTQYAKLGNIINLYSGLLDLKHNSTQVEEAFKEFKHTQRSNGLKPRNLDG